MSSDPALAAYRHDRDAHEQAMATLDAEEARDKASSKVVPASEVVAWLADLPALWAAADDSGRRLLTEAILEKVDVLGVQSVTIHPTPEADVHGWSEAFGTLPLLLNAGRASSTDGRGERSCDDDFGCSANGRPTQPTSSTPARSQARLSRASTVARATPCRAASAR